jgi:UbiD family decarboxylase
MTATAPDLRSFLASERRAGGVVEVEAEVDPNLELAEIHRRVIAAGGPILVFRRVRGCELPVVTNLFGTAARVERAFGRWPEQLVAEAARLPEELVPPTLGKLWAKRALLGSLARVGSRRTNDAPITQVVERPPRLSRLPAIQTWPRDGGRFVTLPLVYTEHPTSGVPNLGMYRIQLFDDDHTGLHMQIGKGGGFHLAEAEAAGQALPVNVHVGGPPALILAAIAPLPENVPELLLASLLLKRKLPLSANPAGPLPLFGEAEVALVGAVEPGARHPEGPFGDHYGYYSETHDYPLLRVDAVTRRRDALFPATVVGKPRQEDFFIGDYLQDLLSPLFPAVMPTVKSLWSYGETGYHSLAGAVVRQRYKREAMVSAFRILGEGQLALTKFLLATDRDVDLRDFRALLTCVLERADFRTDLFLLPNLAMDSLDYAGPRINEGSKGVLLGLGDPIRKLPDTFSGELPSELTEARVFSPGCLVVTGPAHEREPDCPARIAPHAAFADWPLVVLTDDAERATRSTINFLWTTFTRFDPAADLTAARAELVHNHAALSPPIVLDARMKPGYPEELFCDEDTASLVDRRWKEYFPETAVDMGDSDRGHLD